MSRIGFGWFLPNGQSQPEARATFVADVDRNLQAVTGYFTSAWMADHLQAEQYDMLEGWTTLTYYAARHPELLFGHAVLCQSYRNPALLAKTAATFQFLTGGRLVFGLGAGWKEDEYLAYNYPFPSPGTRVDGVGGGAPHRQGAVDARAGDLRGQTLPGPRGVLRPKPDPIPPIVIGGRQPRMLRLIAQEADWWDVSGFGLPRSDYPALAAAMDAACAAMGPRPPDPAAHLFGILRLRTHRGRGGGAGRGDRAGPGLRRHAAADRGAVAPVYRPGRGSLPTVV